MVGCKDKTPSEAAIESEAISLENSAEKRKFLEEIVRSDQEVRRNHSSQSLIFGYDSEEVELAAQEMRRQDVENLKSLRSTMMNILTQQKMN